MAARQRSNRDWASMSEADWARVEEELEEPEDKAAREEAVRKAQQPKQTIDMEAYNNAKTEEDKQKMSLISEIIADELKKQKQEKAGAPAIPGGNVVVERGEIKAAPSQQAPQTEYGENGELIVVGIPKG